MEFHCVLQLLDGFRTVKQALLVDELSLEFHCVSQLQDRSRNVNGTFMSGSIMSSSDIFGGRLAELLRFAGVQHTVWKEVSRKMHF